MLPFLYERARDPAAAAASVHARLTAQGRRAAPPVHAAAQYIAGGTNMTDYMKLDVTRPQMLVDLNGLDRSRFGAIKAGPKGLRLGALVRMGEAEEHEAIKRDYPVIAQALQQAASQQIRNMASLGGNVLQRTRCEYFRDPAWPCNRREPGSGCAAMDGLNRQHAILGVSEHCIAAYPGDLAQALIALDARIEIAGPQGQRRLPFSQLHRRPGDAPHLETTLGPGEIITAIEVPAAPWTRRSRYLKIRDRDSFAFALASAAVALDLDGDTIRAARIALGGVATVPWRAYEAERSLQGRRLDERAAHDAASLAFAQAAPRKHNAFKVELGKATLVRALLETRDLEVGGPI